MFKSFGRHSVTAGVVVAATGFGLGFTPGSAAAQFPEPGDTVRVIGANSFRAEARFVELDADSLRVHLLAADQRFSLARTDIRRLEARGPASPQSTALRRGAVAGAVAAAGTFVVHWLITDVWFADYCPGVFGECTRDRQAEADDRLRFTLGAGALGFVVGGVHGWTAPGTAWVEVPLP